MSCIDDEIIQKYIDGEATPQEVALIEKHIVNCEKCAVKIDNQQIMATGVKDTINLLAESTIEIPKLAPSVGRSKRRIITGRRLVYGISAASILLFILLITQKKEPENQDILTIMHTYEWEYDANRTISQQPMVFNIIDPEGNVTEYFTE